MICIYDKKTTKGNFDNNGLGILSEAISCYIIEELNGDYSLELEYPANSKKSKYLEEWNIIKADGQLFRIYKVEKNSDGKNVIKVWSKHIFYDLAYYFIESMKAENCSVKTALQKSLIGDLLTIYTVDSDIITANSISVIEKNPVEAIFSIIDIWACGELKRDNFDIKILNSIGKDAGVLIAQGKNIVGLKFNVDTTSVVTKLYPVGKDGIKLTEKYISVPNWNSDKYPPFPIIKKVEFKEAEDEVTLRLLAKESANVIGLSKVSIDVDFIELSKTKEYENYKHLQTVNIGDLVIVRHKDFEIDVKVPVLKIKKDVLTGVNVKVELGQPKDNILNQLDMGIIKTTIDELGNKVAEALSSMLYYANPTALTVGTTAIEPIYLGVTAVSSTNLSMNFCMYCTASSVCTVTIQIQLDNKDIPFTPKQKLQQGDNVVGIPLGIPQVSRGPHYIAVFLKVDTGTLSIPMFNLQCMIDGRNLQGGLSADPAHAECFEKQGLVNMNGLYMSKIKSSCGDIKLENPYTQAFTNHLTVDISAIASGKQMNTNYAISLKKYGEILYFNPQYKYKYSIDDNVLIIDNDGLYFKTVYEGTAVSETIDTGKMYSFQLLDSSNFASIEKLEVK
ncbi:phage tail spike protein [Clostridium magnum]|uniref:Prophage endopeptidase tail n=1 Tax=Clostridium magnum DSM 2767 TaxID=1121326 RepID=A0A161X3C1_9CLOT|nr:phage tail spike protein [Clostridium magnum]KZL93978.1 prophage endopeptidase tail [Clostridium magnum DSM 2767]SHH99719.1 phage minor structural protein, N-terminal region [Clostridium magnum DSM 2767]